MIIQSQAIVLKSFSYSNTSIIARCLTREMGKISVIIHGAKKKNLQKSIQNLQNLKITDLKSI